MDQSSTDSTVDICKRYTDKVFSVPNKGFCEPDRATAAAKAAHEWILYIDADEVISSQLEFEIISLISAEGTCDCYYIPRKNIFLDKWIKGSGWYPGYALRLFRKGSVKFSNDIHADTLPLKKYGYLKNHLIHYTCEDLKDYMNKSDRYTSILARQSYDKGERVLAKNFMWKLFILPAVYFLHRFILKAGIRDGLRGLLIASLTFRTVFMKNTKILKIERGGKL